MDDLRYSAENIWVRIDDGDQAYIGITEEGLFEHEDVTDVRIASEGDVFSKDEGIGRLKTTKPSVIRIYAPVSGEVLEVNEEILDTPEMVSEDPYDEGWLLRIELSNMTEFDDLMDREEYENYLGEDLPKDDDEDVEDVEDEDDEVYDEDEDFVEEL